MEETSGAVASRARLEGMILSAVLHDDAELLAAALSDFRTEALAAVGSSEDSLGMLQEEMNTTILDLARKHDAVNCARLLLQGSAPAPADARDPPTATTTTTTPTTLDVAAAETDTTTTSTSPAPAQISVVVDGCDGTGPPSAEPRTHEEAGVMKNWIQVQVLALLTAAFAQTSLLTVTTSVYMDLDDSLTVWRILVNLYAGHILISYALLKPAALFRTKKFIKKWIPAFCLLSQNLSAVLFSTMALDYVSLRATIFLPIICASGLPYCIWACMKNKEIGFSGLALSSGHALLLLRSAEKNGWINIPGDSWSYATAEVIALFLFWDLVKIKLNRASGIVKAALDLYVECTVESKRTMIAALIYAFSTASKTLP